MRSLLAVLYSVICVSEVRGHAGHHSTRAINHTPVLLWSMDGFRADYMQRIPDLTKNTTDYFTKIFENGVVAPEGILNAYTTLTFPNHYSIATGLHEESHGILGNSVYDVTNNRSVNMITRQTYDGKSLTEDDMAKLYGGEPLWVTYMKQRDPSEMASVMWPASDLPIHNMRLPPKNVIPYNKSSSCLMNANKAVEYLKSGMQLVMLYFQEPDHTGHGYGPDSVEMNQTLLVLNTCLGVLWNGLHDVRVNLILTSDHGMTSTTETVIIPPRDDLYHALTYHYDHWLIKANPGKESETINYINSKGGSNLKVYSKENIPKRWYYANNERVSDILVVGIEGVQLTKDSNVSQGRLKGEHGFDNALSSMRPFFRATGPGFIHETNLTGFINVDIYLTICTLLGLEPAPNNGTVSNVARILNTTKDSHSTSSLMGFWCVTSFLVGLSFFLCHMRREHVHKYYGRTRTPQTNGYRYRPMFGEQVVTLCSDDSEDELYPIK